MRIVQARKRVWNIDYCFANKFNLLVWVLSILKWKEYGNQVVLYTDTETLEEIKKIGFDTLYDEINTELFDKGAICENINFEYYWAMPKIIALHYETYHLGNKNVVVSDQDVVPMKDFNHLFSLADCTVWSNKEHVEVRSIYPRLHELSLPHNYELPKWYKGLARPLNTGLLHFRKNKHAIEFCDEVFKYVKDNTNDKKNTKCIAMCNAEQRMLGEFLNWKGLTYGTIQPNNQGLFNTNAFHTHGYKNVIGNNNLDWNCKLLNMIKPLNYILYNKLIDNKIFEEEKNNINIINCNLKQFDIYLK